MKLNLGCGRDIKKGYINLDKSELKDIDIIHDLDKFPYPFEDNAFEVIYCQDILEHLSDIIKVMEELHRISKPNAKIIIKTPYFPGMYAITDLTHKNFFNYNSFDIFTKKHSLNFYSKARFKIEKRKIIFSWNKLLNLLSMPINLFPTFYQRYFSFILPSNGLYFELRVIK